MLAHPYNVHFTMLSFAVHYIFEQKCNNMEDVNTLFLKLNFWHHYELVVLGWVGNLAVRVGLGQEKWTHGHYRLPTTTPTTQ